MKESILKYALLNAREYGKAASGPVIAKVIAEKPELRKNIQELAKQTAITVKQVNALSQKELELEFSKLFPDGFHKEKKEKRIGFPELKNVEIGKIVTCHPPETSKYPHIGHAYACFVNYWYAKEYKGKFILRFEDTNPKLVRAEYYDAFIDSYKWFGIDWDELVYASDYMKEIYQAAEKLIKENKAYTCVCLSEKIRELRANKKECPCRNKPVEQNMAEWEKMLKGGYKEGEITLRVKINMKHKNANMRDPSIMRIVDHPHPRTGTKYKVWPMYGFQSAITDDINKVTFRMRSKEFELHKPFGDYLSKILKIKNPQIIEFARVNLKSDIPSSGRKIRELIQKKELSGWDDPRLTTLVALKRRGFLPESIKNWIFSLSVTKHESTLGWESLESENKKLIEPIANRYFFVENPVKIDIAESKYVGKYVESHTHPEKEEKRKLKVSSSIYVNSDDFKNFSGKVIRLKDLCTGTLGLKLRIDKKEEDSLSINEKPLQKIQWVPEENISAEIVMPDNSRKSGLCEKNCEKLEPGNIIQFERFGFCCIDSVQKDKIVAYFTHK